MPAIKRLGNVPSDEFCPRIVTIPRPTRHFRYLNTPSGDWLGTADGESLQVFGHVDDAVIWDVTDVGFKHVVSGLELTATTNELNATCRLTCNDERVAVTEHNSSVDEFAIEHGPELLPSSYLETLNEQGWVSITCILPDSVLDGLQRVGCVDGYEDRTPVRQTPLAQDPSVAQVSAEPISLWLTREYMKTNDIRLGHSPGISALTRDDGTREVQGWHTDFPYLWGTGDRIPAISCWVCNEMSVYPTSRGKTVQPYSSSDHTRQTRRHPKSGASRTTPTVKGSVPNTAYLTVARSLI